MLDVSLLLRLPLSLQTVVFWLLFNFFLLIYFFGLPFEMPYNFLLKAGCIVPGKKN